MLGHDLSDEEVAAMAQRFDADGSGDIGFPEFVQLIREQVL
jgi:Ca2+-binding EF-hand superfamily protein